MVAEVMSAAPGGRSRKGGSTGVSATGSSTLSFRAANRAKRPHCLPAASRPTPRRPSDRRIFLEALAESRASAPRRFSTPAFGLRPTFAALAVNTRILLPFTMPLRLTVLLPLGSTARSFETTSALPERETSLKPPRKETVDLAPARPASLTG